MHGTAKFDSLPAMLRLSNVVIPTESTASLTGSAQPMPHAVVRSHFWVAHTPLIEMTLFIGSNLSPEEQRADLQLFDCEGELVNELTVTFPAGELHTIDIGSLLQRCRLQNGFPHGQLVVSSASGTTHALHVHSKNQGTLVPNTPAFDEDHPSFIPIRLGTSRDTFVALVNTRRESAAVTLRLISGKRSPETICVLPPLGSRMISIYSEFPEFVESRAHGLAYIRLRTRTSWAIGSFFFEQVGSDADWGLQTIS
jgi:hypothetical protein